MKKVFAIVLVGASILSTIGYGNNVYANNTKDEVLVYNAGQRGVLPVEEILDTSEDKVVLIQNSQAFIEDNEALFDELKIPYLIPEDNDSEEISKQFSHTVVVVKDNEVYLNQLNETVVNLETEEADQLEQPVYMSHESVEDEINNVDNLKKYAQEFADSIDGVNSQGRAATRASGRLKYSDYVYADCTNAGVTRYLRLCDVETLYFLTGSSYNNGGYNIGVDVQSEITPMSDNIFVTKYYGEEMTPSSSTTELDKASPQTSKTVNSGSSIDVSIGYPYSIGTSFKVTTNPSTTFYASSSGDDYEVYYKRGGALANSDFLLNYALGYFTTSSKLSTRATHTVGYGVDSRAYASKYADLTPYRLNWSF